MAKHTTPKETPVKETQAKDADKQHKAALETAISSITKAFGSGSIMRFGDAQSTVPVKAVSTGVISLDCALGVGGIPRGRIIEIYGPESSGKTTLVLQTIAQVQKAGGIAAFIDAEHAFDPKYAKALGVNLDDMLISQPSNGEEALGIAETLAKSGAVDFIAIDSVAALTPKAEIEGEMGMATMGMQARLMSQGLRKLTAILHKNDTICFFTNQLREKVGVMFGSPETTPGGKALKFYASIRLDIRRKETIKDAAGNPTGNHVRVKVVKNKVAPPFAETEFDIFFGKGVNYHADLLTIATDLGIIEKKGAWFQFAGELLGQGKDATAQTLADKPEITAKIVEAVLKAKVSNHIPAETVESIAPEIPEAELAAEE